jgi:hypothetical protein
MVTVQLATTAAAMANPTAMRCVVCVAVLCVLCVWLFLIDLQADDHQRNALSQQTTDGAG